ncbi:MAG: alpha/beta hydrolase [Ramlibacter sp.]|nr:alpha/beta hydrolase [Ramlibacter sp.]
MGLRHCIAGLFIASMLCGGAIGQGAWTQADIAVEKDISLRVIDGGDRNAKTTILFVPGWGMTTAVWRDAMAAFASRARVVSLDPRSQGFSTLAPRGNTPERRAIDLHEVIKALALDKVVLVGWSQGVQDVAAYAAAFEGERVAGYVLVDSPLGAGPAAAMSPPAAMQQQLERMSLYARYPREYLRGMMNAIIQSPAGKARIEEFVELGLRTPPDLGIGMLMMDFVLIDRRPALKKFNRPTLVIAAEGPNAESQRAMAQQIGGAQFEAVAQAGHAVFLDQPDKFNELLARFLARLGA